MAQKAKKNQAKQTYTLKKEKASYLDIFQKRATKLRLYETMFYIAAIILFAAYFPSEGTAFKVFAVLAAVVIIGGGPFLYRKLLTPEYILTKTDLIIRIRGKERSYPLTEVKKASKWRTIYRLNEKKESIMASTDFLSRLDEQLDIVQNNKKR